VKLAFATRPRPRACRLRRRGRRRRPRGDRESERRRADRSGDRSRLGLGRELRRRRRDPDRPRDEARDRPDPPRRRADRRRLRRRLRLERRLVGRHRDANRPCGEQGSRHDRGRRGPGRCCLGAWILLDVEQVRHRVQDRSGYQSRGRADRGGAGASLSRHDSDALWVASFDDSTLHRIDPRTNRVDKTVPAGSGPQGLAARDGALWVASYDTDAVLELDPVTVPFAAPSPLPRGAARRESPPTERHCGSRTTAAPPSPGSTPIPVRSGRR
jgi:hypothetical protein